MDYNNIIKIVLVGDSGVGKSCIILRCTENTFNELFISTIGVDFKIHTFTFDGKTIKVQIWDTAGQERFRSIITSYYRGADGVMYVYDVTNTLSFTHIDVWYETVTANVGSHIGLLVGNKSDNNFRYVSKGDVSKYANERKIDYIEVSAKTGDGILDAFNMLVVKILEKYMNRDINGKDKKIIQSTKLINGGKGLGYQLNCCNK